MRTLHFLLALAIAGSLPLAAIGQGSPRLDTDGQPLPPGAVFRLGTRAWRVGGYANSPSWSPDGKRLAVIGNYRQVTIFDTENGRRLKTFDLKDEKGAPLGQSMALAFSPGGDELAVRIMPARIVTCDPATGRHRRTYETKVEDFGQVEGPLKYSPDGKYIASSFYIAYAVIERESGEVIVQERIENQVRGLAFTADSSRLVVGGYNPPLKVWDLKKRALVKMPEVKRSQDTTTGLAVAGDGNVVAYGGREVIVYDIARDEEKARLAPDDAADVFFDVAFTADGKQLLATSQKGAIHIWNTADWSRRARLSHDGAYCRGFAVSADGRRAAVTDQRSRVWVWDLAAGKLLGDERPAHDAPVAAVAFAPDGGLLATGSDGNDTHLWDARTGRHVRKLAASSQRVAFADSGRRLVTSWSAAPQLRTWEVATGEEVAKWSSENAVRMAVPSGDQSHMVAVIDQPVQPRGYRLERFTWPDLRPAGRVEREGYSRAVGVSDDGRLAATFGQYGIDLWNLAEDKLITELPAQSYTDRPLFTPDGRYLVGALRDRSIKVWELASLHEVHSLPGDKGMPLATALSPSGRVLAAGTGSIGVPAGDEPRLVQFWDLATGEAIASIEGLDADIGSLAFSADGALLASGLRDTTVVVWEVPEAVRQVAFPRRALTADEAAAAWDELASADAKTAHAAMVRLAGDPPQALATAEARLKPAVPSDVPALTSLIQQLDAEAFADRRAAHDKLAAFGSVIEPQLKAALAATESSEVKLRCGELLNQMRRRYPLAAPALAQSRAVELLEWIGDERARALLNKLATGAPDAHLTKEATMAIRRLGQ